MKRIVTALITAMLLIAAMCVSASASDFDSVAEDLSKIGMFRGTASGFELDRAPTRSEAAIMLVRLYGAEDTAKADYAAGKISHPFTDVSEFASPYVAWLTTNGIANGTSATTFGSSKACSAQNYVTFLLRALGYQDTADFAYADALTFAQSKGFYDPLLFTGAFLRDDLAAVTYQALAADLKDGSTYLLASLVKSGAIDAKAAAAMTERIEAYRSLNAVSAKMDETAMDADINVKMNMSMSSDGETTTIPTVSTGNMKFIMDGSDVRMAYQTTSVMDGLSVDTGMWMKDGWVYISTASDGEQSNFKYQVPDALAELEALGGMETGAVNINGLAMLDSIAVSKSGSDTVYTVVIGSSMSKYANDLVGSVLGETQLGGMDLSYGDISAVYTVGRDGAIKTIAMVFSASMSMDLGEELGTIAADYDYDMTMTIKATGSAVKITYPDFSKFQEISDSDLAA
ncbi:S-layer homology domain-containing protein [Oscillibacter sp.]|uniref:S-layer homology domain-containing protein n=1 Tax=Oscillibacter sp. TaxID=1945593 RepID=UPI00262BFD82|nr:S-layer homology domain-containing protein [Oscillibacter sp.]MDD3346153.1 S-layer homology domain-containing protein [Oscillibacter sp.]